MTQPWYGYRRCKPRTAYMRNLSIMARQNVASANSCRKGTLTDLRHDEQRYWTPGTWQPRIFHVKAYMRYSFY